jgi:hypothetical protein
MRIPMLLSLFALVPLTAAEQQDPPRGHRGPPPADPALFYLADADKSGGLNNAELVNYLDALALRRPPKGAGDGQRKPGGDDNRPPRPTDDAGKEDRPKGDGPRGDRPQREPPPSKEGAAHLLEVGDADKNNELSLKELEQAMRPPEPPPRD